MSTAARKARKRHANELRREGWYELVMPYRKPEKVGTPVTLRAENQPRQIFGRGARSAATRYGVTSLVKARIAARVHTSTNDYSNGRVTSVEQVQDKGLDPKPVRLGRKRLTLQEGQQAMDAGEQVVFSPRKGYTQKSTEYPTI